VQEMQQKLPDRTKALGQFFTPSYIAKFIVQNTVGSYLLEKKIGYQDDIFILDPSVGEGIFLVVAKDYLTTLWAEERGKNSISKELQKKLVFNHLFGIDVDLNKIKMTRQALGYPNYTENVKTFDALLPKRSIIEKTPEQVLMDWEKNFPKTGGKFHIILGNPPWGADISEIKGKLKYLQTATSQMDSWSLFLERSLLALRDNGYLGFVVPNTLLINPNYVKIREIILKKCQIIHLVNLGEGIFPGVTQPSLIVIVRKAEADENHFIRVIPRISKKEKQLLVNQEMILEDCHYFNCPQERFQKNPQLEFDIFAGSNVEFIQLMEKDVYTDQEKVTPLSTLMMNGRGVEIGKKGRVLQCSSCGTWNPPPRVRRKCINSTCDHFVSPNDIHSEIVSDKQKNSVYDRPFLVGYQIQRYFTLDHRYINTNCQGINYKSPELYQGPKLLVRKTGNIMNWVIDNQNRWVSQVVYIFKRRDDLPKEFDTITLEYLLGILNSKLMLRYINSKFFDPERTDFPHFVQNSILNLPILIPRSKESKETAKRISELTQELQDTYQEIYELKSQNRQQEKLERQVVNLEAKLEKNIELLYSIPKDKSYLK
jgi:hypothetical protein